MFLILLWVVCLPLYDARLNGCSQEISLVVTTSTPGPSEESLFISLHYTYLWLLWMALPVFVASCHYTDPCALHCSDVMHQKAILKLLSTCEDDSNWPESEL